MLMIQRKKKIITLILSLALLAGVSLFVFKPTDDVQEIVRTDGIVDTRCYGTRDLLETNAGYNLVSIDFYENARVIARLDYKNKDLESSGIIQGVYSREHNQIIGIYEFYTDNDLYSEERIIRFNEIGLLFGFGEMYNDGTGIVKYKNREQIRFDYPLPMISCQRYDVWKKEFDDVSSTTGIITVD